MKRVLLCALLLAVALALAWLLIQRKAEPTHSVGAPREQLLDAPERESETVLASELELPPNAHQQSREVPAPDLEPPSESGAALASTEPTIRVRVDVRYEDSNAPVPGAVVRFKPSEASARTNAQGRAEVPMPVGTTFTRLRVDPGDDNAAFVPYERDEEPRPQPDTRAIQVRVNRGCDLRGLVMDAETKRPVAEVRVHCDGFGYRIDDTTAEDGSFWIIGLLAGPLNIPRELTLEHREYLPLRFQPSVSDILPGAQPLQILLQRGIQVIGRIVDSDRVPVVRAEIVLSAPRPYRTHSDERGQFSFEGVGALEDAKLIVGTQTVESCAVMGAEFELGPLGANRSDIELQVESALELMVFAELPDGTQLTGRNFQVLGGSRVVRPGYLDIKVDTDQPAQRRIVPRGPDVDIEVFADATGRDDAGAYVRGKARVQTSRAVASPHAVHVVLSENLEFKIPPLPADAKEIELDGRKLAGGAIDVQLLDASSGRPVGQGRVTTKHRDLNQITNIQGESWLRLRAAPGTYRVEAKFEGGPSDPFIVTVPLSGYAKAEWRLRASP